MQRVRVLVVDDHPLLREGVCRLLAAARDFAVVGEAATGRAALDLAAALRPPWSSATSTSPTRAGRTWCAPWPACARPPSWSR